MNTDDLAARYENLADALDVADEESAEFAHALAEMEALAEHGSLDAAEAVAEIYCFSGRHHDAERAYRWYFRALQARGYTTGFADVNNSPPEYRGPAGDFRNEAAVSGLVTELGFERVRELDAELRGAKWRAS